MKIFFLFDLLLMHQITLKINFVIIFKQFILTFFQYKQFIFTIFTRQIMQQIIQLLNFLIKLFQIQQLIILTLYIQKRFKNIYDILFRKTILNLNSKIINLKNMGCYNSKDQVAFNAHSNNSYSKKFFQYNFSVLLFYLRTKYSEYRQQKSQQLKQSQINSLQQEIRNIFKGLIKQKLSEVNLNKMSIKQCKVQISELFLQILIETLKNVLAQTQHSEDGITFFEQMDSFLRKLTRFLKTKYPRGDNLQAGDLAKKFRQFDSTQQYQYDMLRNSGFTFKSTDDFQITKTIKLFFNRILDELQNQYPKFKAQIESIDPDFKIGRKISQNTSKYSKLDTGTIQIKSPQIARVLVKWMDDLEEAIAKPQSRINQNAQLKFSSLSLDSLYQAKFTKTQQKQTTNLLRQGVLINQLKNLSKTISTQSKSRINKFNRFILTLVQILSKVSLKQTQISKQQMQVIKFCYYNNDYISWIVEEKLIDTIKKLYKVGAKYKEKSGELTLDLVKFKINDLMRCQILGDRKKILHVYDRIIQMEQQGKLEIVKIKNRFQTPLSDAMIFLKFPFSFLICQCQLVLAQENKGDDAKKAKNTQSMNHFLYQLQRSPFGVLGQISVFLKSKSESVSAYCDKIKLSLTNQDRIKTCIKQHQTQTKFQQQLQPFICHNCIGYFAKYSNLMKINQCQLCKTTICNKCSNKKFQITQINISKEIKQRFGYVQKLNKRNSRHILEQQIVLKTLKTSTLQYAKHLFSQEAFAKCFKIDKLKRMKQLFKSNKIKSSQIMGYFQTIQKASIKQQWKVHFIVVTCKRTRLQFKLYRYDPQQEQIVNVYQPLQKYEKYQIFQVNDYDLLLEFSSKFSRIKIKNQKQKLEEYISKGIYFFQGQLKSQLENKLKSIVQDYFLLYSKVEGYYLIIDIDHAIKGSKKVGWLERYLQELPKVNKLRKNINLNQSAIQNIELKCFETLEWTKFIKMLNIESNYITDVSIILKKCQKLEVLNLSHNKITVLSFDNKLQNLKKLNASQNKIMEVKKLQNIKQISELYLANNELNDDFFRDIYAKPSSNKEKNDEKYYFLTQLQRMDLSGNKIKNLPFIRALNLKQLVILNNPLANIAQFMDGYDNLTLWHLTINNYPMSKMPKICRNLTHFSYVNGNFTDQQLQVFVKSQNVQLPNLIQLNFEYNSLNKVPNLTPFTGLQQLNLNHNPINNYDQMRDQNSSKKVYQDLRTIHLPLKYENENQFKDLQHKIYKSLPFTRIFQEKMLKHQQRIRQSNQNVLSDSKKLDSQQQSKPSTTLNKTKSSSWKAKSVNLSRKDSYNSQQTNQQNNQQFQNMQQIASLNNMQYIYHILPDQSLLKQNFIKRWDKNAQYQTLNHPPKFDVNLFIQYNWSHLQHLMISGCELNDNDWKLLVLNANLFPNLKRIELWQNNITTVKKQQIKQFKEGIEIYFDGLGQNPLTQDSKKQLSSIKIYPTPHSKFYGRQCRLIEKLNQITLQWKYHSIMGFGGNYKQNYVPCIYQISNVYFLIFVQNSFEIKDVLILSSNLQFGNNKGKLFFIHHDKDYQKMGIYMERFYAIDTSSRTPQISKIDKMLNQWKRDIQTDTTWISGTGLVNF